MKSKPYVPSKWEVQRHHWLGKPTPPSVYRRWPASQVRRLFSVNEFSSAWGHMIYQIKPSHVSNGYSRHHYHIKDLLRVAPKVRCRICHKLYRHWEPSWREKLDRLLLVETTVRF